MLLVSATRSGWWMNSQSKVVKTLKNPYCLQTVTFKLSLKGRETKIRKEKPNVTNSMALVMHFSRLITKIDNWEICLKRIFAGYLKRFLASVRTKSITGEFCILKIRPMVRFCLVSTHVLSWALAPTYLPIFIRGFSIPLFSFINEVDFSCK